MADESDEQQPEGQVQRTPEELLGELESLFKQGTEHLAAIEDSKVEVDKLRESVKHSADESATTLQRANEILENLRGALADLQTLKTQAEDVSKAIQSFRSDAKADQQVVRDLSTSADALEKNIVENTKRLDEVAKRGDDLAVRLESLLPGAASIGLAKSFMDRKNEFKRPKFWWALLSLVAVGLLIPVGLFGARGLLNLSQPTWQAILEGILLRLPVAGPLVWLAIYAGRHHFLSARLEEDYAYKEAVSRAFEGYKREMESISESKPESDALSVLCANVLQAIAQPPGRLFDRKHTDITPLNAVLEALDSKTVQAIAQQVGQPEDGVRKVISLLVSLLARPFRK